MKKAELSVTRVKTIMKSTENTGNVTREGLFVMTRATVSTLRFYVVQEYFEITYIYFNLQEMFIQYLSRNLYRIANTSTIQYNHLAKLVSEVEKLDFLSQIIPPKITVKRYREIMMAKENETSSEDEDDSQKA